MNWLNHLFRFRTHASQKLNPNTPLTQEQPFTQHLEDLRKLLIRSLITLILSILVALLFRKQLIHLIELPLTWASIPNLSNHTMSSLRPSDSFTISFKLAFYAGFIASAPLLLSYLVHFILPGLHKREKRLLLPILLLSSLLFIGGSTFCFTTVTPRALTFFYQDALNLGWQPNWTAQFYYSFTAVLCLIFGISFELPIVVLTLTKLDLIDSKTMRETRSFAIVIILIFAAVITPTTDILTLSLLAVPMLLLYELCIWITVFLQRKASPHP